MRWSRIGWLSGLGLLMGAASLYGWTRGREPWLWPLVWIFSAIVLARGVPGRPFAHGFTAGALASLVNSVLQVVFLPAYARHNPEVSQMATRLPAQLTVGQFFLVIAPFLAALSGAVLGLLTLLARRLMRRTAAAS